MGSTRAAAREMVNAAVIASGLAAAAGPKRLTKTAQPRCRREAEFT